MQNSYKQLFRLVALALTVIWCLPASSFAAKKSPVTAPAPVKVTIMATAGVNGHLINWDYNFPRTAEFGLVKVASLVKKERQSNPYTILVDGGNMLSGSALTDYFAITPSKLPNPMMAMYNYLDYDAVVLGAGEFAYGPLYLSKAMALAKFPVLAANIRTSDKTWSALKPYTIKELNVGKDKKKEKIRIGIIGVSSAQPDITDKNYAGLKVTDQADAILSATKQLQNKVDTIIVIKNDGIVINGVAAATPTKFGSSISKTDLTFEKIGKKWLVTHTETNNVYAALAPADKGMSDAAWPYHDATLQHLSKRP
ncbi:hypothetical protein [Sporomusa acidovorans]|uniref:2',3'-cyclic-nucleotide 2'-phosphodiesterase/3'-nucleotidase n=1 Tax=Sporomusa acidovorans (strain ATCC 49682 / DSM 3132 / Mol) TaxID=1123286 RepID=A0ABZ3IW85_SPOA4|nr:hypothetical protein [Sporomusa acidovorans]OZC23640.1 2',3'-cyclic-nucleotide 2'-phosphodiesterase/3'-nucleotidase precursor [Sporomusa acidovorans DSM 3132]SDE23556.1 2',3'-cyclic-nucleotide 2'-phosphodiesterase / 3'-nucleotidase [Sporomusa acidovorans]